MRMLPRRTNASVSPSAASAGSPSCGFCGDRSRLGPVDVGDGDAPIDDVQQVIVLDRARVFVGLGLLERTHVAPVGVDDHHVVVGAFRERREHDGVAVSRPSRSVPAIATSLSALAPSASTIQICEPNVGLVNTIRVPSGDQSGSSASCTIVAPPCPSTSPTTRSGGLFDEAVTYAIRVPSGENDADSA